MSTNDDSRDFLDQCNDMMQRNRLIIRPRTINLNSKRTVGNFEEGNEKSVRLWLGKNVTRQKGKENEKKMKKKKKRGKKEMRKKRRDA